MPNIDKIKEYFVPARDLEHSENPEKAYRADKIRLAILRKHHSSPFKGPKTPQKPNLKVVIAKTTFNPESLGYHVLATIKRCA